MKKLLFLNLIIVLALTVSSCQSSNNQYQAFSTSSHEITSVETSETTTMLPVPEYVPTEPPATTTDKLLYQNITLEQASQIIGREIPLPAYLPTGYAITSIQVASVSQPLRDWKIELIIDINQSTAPITMSLSTFSLGMKIPPGAKTVKIGNRTAMVSRQQDSIDFYWINETGWGISLTGSTGMTFEELLKIAESITSPPQQLLQTSIVEDEDLLVLRGESRNIVIHLQNNSITPMNLTITHDTRISNLPAGIDIMATQTSFMLSPGHNLDVPVNVKVGSTVASPAWHYQPVSIALSTDPPPPASPITEQPHYSLYLMVSYKYKTTSELTITGNKDLSIRFRIDPPAVLPEGMVTLKEAEEAADFPVGMLLPSYFPEGTNPVPIGYEISREEPNVVTVFYSDYQVVFSPERGVTEPPAGFTGESTIICRKTAFIGQNRIDRWLYDIHFTVISDNIQMDELKYIAESMMLVAPYSESWLTVK